MLRNTVGIKKLFTWKLRSGDASLQHAGSAVSFLPQKAHLLSKHEIVLHSAQESGLNKKRLF
jgi:hypothetical protein